MKTVRKNKNQVAQKKRSGQQSVKAVREKEVKLLGRGLGFVKQVGFKPGVKEKRELRMSRAVSQTRKK